MFASNKISIVWNILSDRSSQWTSVRKEHLKKQSFCMCCGSKTKLEVHHIEPFHINPDRELDPTNLLTLCSKCHFVFGHLMDYNSWNPEVEIDSSVYYLKVKNRPQKIVTQNVKTFFGIFYIFLDKFYSLLWNYRP